MAIRKLAQVAFNEAASASRTARLTSSQRCSRDTRGPNQGAAIAKAHRPGTFRCGHLRVAYGRRYCGCRRAAVPTTSPPPWHQRPRLSAADSGCHNHANTPGGGSACQPRQGHRQHESKNCCGSPAASLPPPSSAASQAAGSSTATRPAIPARWKHCTAILATRHAAAGHTRPAVAAVAVAATSGALAAAPCTGPHRRLVDHWHY